MAWCTAKAASVSGTEERQREREMYRSSTSEKKSRQRDTRCWAVGWAVRSTSVGGTSLVDEGGAVVVGGMEEFITAAAIVAGFYSRCARDSIQMWSL